MTILACVPCTMHKVTAEDLRLSDNQHRCKAQVVSFQLSTTEGWIQSQASPCLICGGLSGIRTEFI